MDENAFAEGAEVAQRARGGHRELGGARFMVMKVSIAELNVITDKIIGAAIEVHRHLGPGLLESTYEKCLMFELQRLGWLVERQVALPVIYKGVQIDEGYRIDLLVEKQIILELKAVENILPVHKAQILSYLKLSGYQIGLLLNFNVKLMKDGIHRCINSGA